MRLVITTMLLFSCLIFANEGDPVVELIENIKGEQGLASDVLGTWNSEPALGQLGMIRSSYTFREDDTFSLNLDFISFCDANRGVDCDYFWIVHEGSYTDHDGVFTINIEKEKKVILLTGHPEPKVTESSKYPNTYDILVELQDGKLLIRESANDEATVFNREN